MVSRAADWRVADRLFEAQLEAHHEIDPALLISANGLDHGSHLRFGKSVVAKNLGDFFGFDVRQFDGFAEFAVDAPSRSVP